MWWSSHSGTLSVDNFRQTLQWLDEQSKFYALYNTKSGYKQLLQKVKKEDPKIYSIKKNNFILTQLHNLVSKHHISYEDTMVLSSTAFIIDLLRYLFHHFVFIVFQKTWS